MVVCGMACCCIMHFCLKEFLAGGSGGTTRSRSSKIFLDGKHDNDK